jgi:transposase, IS5 family
VFATKSSVSGARRSEGLKVYSLQAPEVKCIGRGKARAPYEFGCKVSIATTAPGGGQFVLHAKALHGNPYDGRTLGLVIADLEKLTGVAVCRIHGDKGYRGHNHPDRFKVWITGQVRRVTKPIRREMRRSQRRAIDLDLAPHSGGDLELTRLVRGRLVER